MCIQRQLKHFLLYLRRQCQEHLSGTLGTCVPGVVNKYLHGLRAPPHLKFTQMGDSPWICLEAHVTPSEIVAAVRAAAPCLRRVRLGARDADGRGAAVDVFLDALVVYRRDAEWVRTVILGVVSIMAMARGHGGGLPPDEAHLVCSGVELRALACEMDGDSDDDDDDEAAPGFIPWGPPPAAAIRGAVVSMDALVAKLDAFLCDPVGAASRHIGSEIVATVNLCDPRGILFSGIKIWFDAWMSGVCVDDAFLREAGCMSHAAVAAMHGVPCMEDVVAFASRFPAAVSVPPTWYRVCVWEVPSLATSLPLRGRHVLIAPRDMPEWIWHRVLRALRRAKSLAAAAPADARSQLVTIGEALYARERARAPRGRKRDRSDCAGTIDMEDIVAAGGTATVLAPCVRCIVDPARGRFPGDALRNQLARVCNRAHIKIGVVMEYLEPLNEAHPHMPMAKSVEERANTEYQYTKGYPPASCDAVTTCPFRGGTMPPRQQCHEQFAAEHPRKYRAEDAVKFYNPAAWTDWAMRKITQ